MNETLASLLKLLAPRTLRGQAFGLLLAAIVAGAAIGQFFAVPWVTRGFDAEVRRRSESFTQVLDRHRDVRAAMATNNRRLANDLSAKLLEGDADLRYIILLNAQGHVVGGAASGADRDLAGIAATHAQHPGGEIQRFTHSVRSKDDAPEDDGGPEIGSIMLGVSAATARRLLTLQTLGTVIACTAFLVFGMLLFLRGLATQLSRLAVFASDVAAGKITTSVQVSSDDELGYADPRAGGDGQPLRRDGDSSSDPQRPRWLARPRRSSPPAPTRGSPPHGRRPPSRKRAPPWPSCARPSNKPPARRAVIDLAKHSEESTSTGGPRHAAEHPAHGARSATR